MLKTRLISALIAVPIVFYCTIKGGQLFMGIIAFVCFMFSEECLKLFGNININYESKVIAFLITIATYNLHLNLVNQQFINLFLLSGTGLYFLWNHAYAIEYKHRAITASWLAIFIVPFFVGNLLELRLKGDNGTTWIILAFFLAFLNDTGAYFAGRFFGKEKILVEVSPKKTWAGYIGGLITSILVGLCFGLIYPNLIHHGLIWWISLGFVCGIIAPNGDFMESVFKRFWGIKDSGKFLPGHGGVYDRIDALIWVAPIILFFKSIQ